MLHTVSGTSHGPEEGQNPLPVLGTALASPPELLPRHKEAPNAEEEAQNRLQIFGSRNTENLLTEHHITSLIFKQNSPSMLQTHIEHFRIIDFNGEFCPTIDGTAQPKVNCFLVSIFYFFFAQAGAGWKTVSKCKVHKAFVLPGGV